MIFPLEKLIQFNGNMYEITCAASRRSYQLSMLKDDPNFAGEIEDNYGKVVSLAAKQVFDGEIKYTVETEASSKQLNSY
ncbi:MAG: DNA-directed RNA polymerase subunit omega [Termitinemataceae bacterium]|nr:MAG: DNA-directed RNA polymerase subunit omega [Termitinemataceae bacterium]